MVTVLRPMSEIRPPLPDPENIIVKFDWGYGHVEHKILESWLELDPFRGHAARSMQVEFADGKIFSRWIYPYDSGRHDANHPGALLRFPGAAALLYTVPSAGLVDYAQRMPARLVVIFGEGLIYQGEFPEDGLGYVKGFGTSESWAEYVDEECRKVDTLPAL